MLLAVVVILATRQDPVHVRSSWAQAFSFASLSPADVLDSFFLITGSSKLNNPLWTLRWEILFSLFLPVVALSVATVKRRRWLWLVFFCVVSGAGSLVGVAALTYGPMFLVGALIASIVLSRNGEPLPLRAWVLFMCGLALLLIPDIVRLWASGPAATAARSFSQAAVVLGAALVVYALTFTSGLARVLSSAPFRFLGRISFSLYLVHVPLLLGALHLFPERPHWALMVSAPVIIALAWLFCLFVEEPSARLARRAGKKGSAIAVRMGEFAK